MIAALALALMLAGCALEQARQARGSYDQSVADYRQCLTDNPNNVKACDSKRLIMESEESHWANLRCGVDPASCNSINSTVTVQSR
jgi:ABC-type uncharacterized transport system auxiliary subunit